MTAMSSAANTLAITTNSVHSVVTPIVGSMMVGNFFSPQALYVVYSVSNSMGVGVVTGIYLWLMWKTVALPSSSTASILYSSPAETV